MNYYRKNRFDFSNFEITKREILASISIILTMLFIGVLISSKISEHYMDKNEIYNKAVKIDSQDLFQYGMDTNIGNAFVYGDLKAVDTVSYPDIEGEYIRVVKVEEHYNLHTETYTTTDSKGKSQVKTRTYWSWDYYDEEEKHADKISFLNTEFNYGKIKLPNTNYINTIYGGYHVRYVYSGVSTKYTGTIFTNLKDKTISDNSSFYNNMNIEETVNYLESNSKIIIFWIVWIILICGCIYGFYYIDNEWLE